MKASDVVKTLVNIIVARGDLEVDVSVAKQPDSPQPDQQYLVACAKFVEVEDYSKEDGGPKISIRDWPY